MSGACRGAPPDSDDTVGGQPVFVIAKDTMNNKDRVN